MTEQERLDAIGRVMQEAVESLWQKNGRKDAVYARLDDSETHWYRLDVIKHAVERGALLTPEQTKAREQVRDLVWSSALCEAVGGLFSFTEGREKEAVKAFVLVAQAAALEELATKHEPMYSGTGIFCRCGASLAPGSVTNLAEYHRQWQQHIRSLANRDALREVKAQAWNAALEEVLELLGGMDGMVEARARIAELQQAVEKGAANA